MPMNPYQGLKRLIQAIALLKKDVTMPMNPYQGLKRYETILNTLENVRHNANESLSGIETQPMR